MGAKQTKPVEITSDTKTITNSVQLQEIRQKTGMPKISAQNSTPKMSETLRRRFFSGFMSNINNPLDPRSPGLNRTPLVFDQENDKTLNLDDTFADLFVANRALPDSTSNVQNMEIVEDNVLAASGEQNIKNPPGEFNEFEKSLSGNESDSVVFASLCEEETMPSPAILEQTPLMYHQDLLDPRSPTIGLIRTPIVFDDEEAEEDAMLEDILATLSLDFSAASSFNSNGNNEVASPVGDVKKPTNKHLERVKKPEKPKRKSKQLLQKQKIYLDTENVAITPKRTAKQVVDSPKRTPLSCMKNRSNVRSRSVESNGKSTKGRLSLTSYDDTLNPVQDKKIFDLHHLQVDPFDL